MSNKARVLKHLQALSIPCEVYEHPAVFTMEECLALPYAAPDVTRIFCCATASRRRSICM